MSTLLDGYAMLVAVGTHPAAFPDLKADIAKAAQSLLTKQVKKCKDVKMLRELASAIGRDAMLDVSDLLKDSELATIVKKLDKVRAPTIEAAGMRLHLVKLALAEIEPEGTAPKKARTTKSAPKGLLEQTSAFGEIHQQSPGKKKAPAQDRSSVAGASEGEAPSRSSPRKRRG